MIKSADMAVFAKEFPEARLVLEVEMANLEPAELNQAVMTIARSMWGSNCHYGLVVTPSRTYVLRDDFSAAGREAIRITNTFSTAELLGRVGWPVGGPRSGEQLEMLARKWLEKLAASYDDALPENPDIMNAFFPDIVGAVADGRVVSEAAI